jgi:tripartite-type tricarboxylate transporter receptor subunit TctC
MKATISLAALAAVCLGAGSASADAIEDFYKDKQVTLVVGYETGGGYDSYAAR